MIDLYRLKCIYCSIREEGAKWFGFTVLASNSIVLIGCCLWNLQLCYQGLLFLYCPRYINALWLVSVAIRYLTLQLQQSQQSQQ